MPQKTVQLSLNLATEIGELFNRFTQAVSDSGQLAIQIGERLERADDAAGFDFDALPFNASAQKIFRNFYARRAELTGEDGRINSQMMLPLLALPAVRDHAAKVAGPGSGAWMAFASPLDSLHSWLRKREAESAISDWPRPVREMLVDRLRPLVAILETLEELDDQE